MLRLYSTFVTPDDLVAESLLIVESCMSFCSKKDILVSLSISIGDIITFNSNNKTLIKQMSIFSVPKYNPKNHIVRIIIGGHSHKTFGSFSRHK